MVVRIPQKMVGVVQAAFGSGERDPNGPISVVGVGRIAGEVASAEPARGRPTRSPTMLGVLASLNFALFVFNLIPLLPLDGGHVAGALWEGAAAHRSPGSGTGPTPGPSTSPACCPSPTASATVLIVMSVIC